VVEMAVQFAVMSGKVLSVASDVIVVGVALGVSVSHGRWLASPGSRRGLGRRRVSVRGYDARSEIGLLRRHSRCHFSLAGSGALWCRGRLCVFDIGKLTELVGGLMTLTENSFGWQLTTGVFAVAGIRG
jgi:hypothetical protein